MTRIDPLMSLLTISMMSWAMMTPVVVLAQPQASMPPSNAPTPAAAAAQSGSPSPEEVAKKYVKGQSKSAPTERSGSDTGDWLAQPMEPLSQEPLQEEPLVEEPLTFEEAGAAFVPRGMVESRNRCQQSDRAAQRDALLPRSPLTNRTAKAGASTNASSADLDLESPTSP